MGPDNVYSLAALRRRRAEEADRPDGLTYRQTMRAAEEAAAETDGGVATVEKIRQTIADLSCVVRCDMLAVSEVTAAMTVMHAAALNLAWVLGRELLVPEYRPAVSEALRLVLHEMAEARSILSKLADR